MSSEETIEERLNKTSEIFRRMREGRYVVTPLTYNESHGVVTIGGGKLVDKETGELVQ
jgi:hypothetical protein